MSDSLRFVVCCVGCRSPLVLLTGCQDADGVWLLLRCSHCGATQRAGPLHLEECPPEPDPG